LTTTAESNDDDNSYETLDEYLASLSESDIKLMDGVPLKADELINIDDEELDALKIGNSLTEEEQARRSEIFEEIWRLRIFAKVGRDAKDHGWNYYFNESGLAELNGNVFYKINEKPAKFVIALQQTKQLIEAALRVDKKEVDGCDTLVKSLTHTKTYLTCIPIKIVRHKNPLTFLDQTAKYTMSFVDSVGEQCTFNHKTLSEILSGLRDRGYVFADGAEGALGTMVQAFKKRRLIEDNDAMDYTGFFIVDKKIIASNIEIKQIGYQLSDSDLHVDLHLGDALKFIDELAPYFENRLDLLSTLITWAIIAPAIFMLKTNNYFLKWLHFYGFPNSTKANLILAN
jgi:hypothetical protein